MTELLLTWCDSDEVVKYQAMPTGFPRIPGHEIVGEVVAVPSSEKVWKVGDRVGSGWHGGHCHVCKACSCGDFIMCEKENINGERVPINRWLLVSPDGPAQGF